MDYFLAGEDRNKQISQTTWLAVNPNLLLVILDGLKSLLALSIRMIDGPSGITFCQ